MSDLPDIWDSWVIQEPLGEGSFGVVYRACHRDSPSMLSAVKVIEIPREEQIAEWRQEGLTEEEISAATQRQVQQTESEIRWMVQYKGTPNIVDIEDFLITPNEDRAGSKIIIRMELLKTLREYTSDKQLDEEEILQIGIDICKALTCCHSDGVLHRDIKPDNIFVDDRQQNGVVYKLGDFGSASAQNIRMEEKLVQGSMGYLAPEIANGKPATARSDLYSLGLSLYRFLNENRLPFLPKRQIVSADDQAAAMHMRWRGMPLPPPENASNETAAVILKSCAYDPEQRYRSADEMRQALERARDQWRKKKAQERNRERQKNLRSFSRGWKITILLGFLLTVFIGGYLFWGMHRKNVFSGMDSGDGIKLLSVTEKEKISLYEQNRQRMTALGQTIWEAAKDGEYLVIRSALSLPDLIGLIHDIPTLRWEDGDTSVVIEDSSMQWDVMLEKPEGTESLTPGGGKYDRRIENPLLPEYKLYVSMEEKGRISLLLEYIYDTVTLTPAYCMMAFRETDCRDVFFTVSLRDEQKSILYRDQPHGRPELRIQYDWNGNPVWTEIGNMRWNSLEDMQNTEGMMIYP